jgi:putative ABC transport system ATP-binding protein
MQARRARSEAEPSGDRGNRGQGLGVDDCIPVRLDRVNHFFGKGALRKQVLQELSFEIQPGEIVILTGPSGSGKTTALTLIGALRSAQEGSVRILGHELVGASRATLIEVRRQVG